MDLTGKAVAITGAGSGIGRGIALAMAQAGARVAVADIDQQRADAVAKELGDAGGTAIAVATDVRDPASVEALANATVEAFGTVHVICNNAGVATVGRTWEVDLDDWKWILDVCLYGVVHGVRSFVPRILQHGEGGRVVNVTSMAGLLTSPQNAPYAAAKHGVVGLSKSLRAELSGTGVGVTIVCPGHVRTPIVQAIRDHWAQRGDTPAAVTERLDELQQGSDRGMPPEEAGRLIVDAVRADRLWVLPNGEQLMPLFQRDLDALFADANG
jgi:NAD(P)-dependent dehydrogenase (short-subunit alcohol dehydrogenase family)